LGDGSKFVGGEVVLRQEDRVEPESLRLEPLLHVLVVHAAGQCRIKRVRIGLERVVAEIEDRIRHPIRSFEERARHRISPGE